MSACTATGARLIEAIVRLVPRLARNEIPASIGRKLTVAVDKVERQQRRAALLGATTMLDPDGIMSLWHVSETLGGRPGAVSRR